MGGSGTDGGHDIAVDSAGNAYVTGSGDSSDFPTGDAIQLTYGGGPFDAFATKIEAPLYNLCLRYDPTKAVHSGSNVPIKLTLCDAAGNDLSSPSVTLQAIRITKVSNSISGPVQEAATFSETLMTQRRTSISRSRTG